MNFTLRSIPSHPMTKEEMERQNRIVSHVAKATDYFSDDELEMPAFRVTYNDGSSYVTSMAKGITLDQAKAYFLGAKHEQTDEKTFLTVVNVEKL